MAVQDSLMFAKVNEYEMLVCATGSLFKHDKDVDYLLILTI